MDGEDDRSSDTPGRSANDLEYDLAHEGEEAARLAWQSGPQHVKEPVQVPTISPDHDRDYGYDLVHDVPGH